MHRSIQILFIFVILYGQQRVRAEQRHGMHHQDHQLGPGDETLGRYKHGNHYHHHKQDLHHQNHHKQHHHHHHHQEIRHQGRPGSVQNQNHQLQRLPFSEASIRGGRRLGAEEGRRDAGSIDHRKRAIEGSESGTIQESTLRSEETEPGNPTGFIMKRKKQDQRQLKRNFHLSKNILDIVIRFNGQCAYFRQLSPKVIQRKLKREIFRINKKIKDRILLLTYACIEKLIINIFLPLYPKINFSKAFESMDHTSINISGNVFQYEGWAFKTSLVVAKDSPKYSETFKISVNLLFLSLASLGVIVLTAVVVAQCYYCIKEQILRPPLLDLTRYSEDEMPKCMRSDGNSKRGSSTRSMANVYVTPIPGLQNYRNKDGSPPMADVYGHNSMDDSIDNFNSDWSSEMELPRDPEGGNLEDPTIYATVNKSVKTKGLQTSTETPSELNKDPDEIVPLFQCQSLNRDYDFVAQDNDSDLESLDDPPMDSPCITRVTYSGGEEGQAKLETDL